MTYTTDCARRGVRRRGCTCDFCQDAAIARDGEAVHCSILFMDATQQQMKEWGDSVFQRAGVPIRPGSAEPEKAATADDGWSAAIFDRAGVPMKAEARARSGAEAPPVSDAAARDWPASIFDAAGVPMKADARAEALAEHNEVLAAGMKAEAREERAKARRENAEARQQAQTANRTAQAGEDEWAKAIREHNRTLRRAGLTPDAGGRAA